MIPRRISGCPYLSLRWPSLTSQASMSSLPPPSAWPLTRAMTGWGGDQRGNLVVSRSRRFTCQSGDDTRRRGWAGRWGRGDGSVGRRVALGRCRTSACRQSDPSRAINVAAIIDCGAIVLGLDELVDVLETADVVISATGAPGPVFDAQTSRRLATRWTSTLPGRAMSRRTPLLTKGSSSTIWMRWRQ